MITILVKLKYITQVQYNDIIESIQINKLKCTCSHYGCLYRYGYYTRTIKSPYGSCRVEIVRVRCRLCGKTHALLVSCIVPYQTISLSDQVELINLISNKKSLDDFLCFHEYIDENNVKRIFRMFIKHWKNRLISAGIDLQQTITESCFKHYSRQFMQIKKTVNVLFMQPT